MSTTDSSRDRCANVARVSGAGPVAPGGTIPGVIAMARDYVSIQNLPDGVPGLGTGQANQLRYHASSLMTIRIFPIIRFPCSELFC